MNKQIGDMDVSFRAGEIEGPAGRVSVDPQPMAVLAHLADHVGQFCSRDALMASAWPGRVVSDTTLTATISLLRRALRDAGIRRVRIETRSKRGYCLQAETMSDADIPSKATRSSAGLNRYTVLLSIMLITAALATVRMTPDSPATAVRLDYELETPDGSRYSPSIIVEAGETGEIELSDSLLTLQVRVLEIRSDRVRLNTQLNSGSTHLGLLKTLLFESQTQITFPDTSLSNAPYSVNVRATPQEQSGD